MSILVTGGAGYIGSHTCVELIKNGYDIVIADNFCNSKRSVIERIEKISGKKGIHLYDIDVCDFKNVCQIFERERIDAVLHFAGLKAVGESNVIPVEYYQNNITSTLSLLRAMKKYDCKKIVFSSSATVYGAPKTNPIKEDAELHVSNPYGRSKLIIEDILRDLYKSDNSFNIALLRYFNPIGSHESYILGDDPSGIPNNLLPYITQVASGKLAHLNVFGNDYDTHDGTGVRDYIHVCDLAYGHVLALKKLETNSGLVTYNLGTGTGYSVLDIINAFEKVNNVKIPYEIVPRRMGDIDTCYADPTKAKEELGFVATRNLEDMCLSAWKWQQWATNNNI